jgi:hypothetical protein
MRYRGAGKRPGWLRNAYAGSVGAWFEEAHRSEAVGRALVVLHGVGRRKAERRERAEWWTWIPGPWCPPGWARKLPVPSLRWKQAVGVGLLLSEMSCLEGYTEFCADELDRTTIDGWPA